MRVGMFVLCVRGVCVTCKQCVLRVVCDGCCVLFLFCVGDVCCLCIVCVMCLLCVLCPCCAGFVCCSWCVRCVGV